MATKEELMKRSLRTVEVDIGDDMTVTVRELSGAEAQELANMAKAGDKPVMTWVASKTILNDDGTRMFSDKEQADVGKLGFVALKRIHDAVAELCQFDGEDSKKK